MSFNALFNLCMSIDCRVTLASSIVFCVITKNQTCRNEFAKNLPCFILSDIVQIRNRGGGNRAIFPTQNIKNHA